MGRCVFFIKMLHSINPICRKDTGGDPGTQLRELSLLSLGPVLFPSSENRSPQPRFLSTWLPFPGKGKKKKKSLFLPSPAQEKPQRGVKIFVRLPSGSD